MSATRVSREVGLIFLVGYSKDAPYLTASWLDPYLVLLKNPLEATSSQKLETILKMLMVNSVCLLCTILLLLLIDLGWLREATSSVLTGKGFETFSRS